MSVQSRNRTSVQQVDIWKTRYISHRLNCCHTRRTAVDNRTGLTSWTLTRWRDQHTSDKVVSSVAATPSDSWWQKMFAMSATSPAGTSICRSSPKTWLLRRLQSVPGTSRKSRPLQVSKPYLSESWYLKHLSRDPRSAGGDYRLNLNLNLGVYNTHRRADWLT